MTEPSGAGPTVILVESDAGLREALRYALEIDGFDVASCASGEILLARPLPPGRACLLLDHRLPGLSGIATLEILRSRRSELPAIIIATAPDAELRARALVADALLIEMPLLDGRLVCAIRDLIDPV
jgi:two-component system, LuxR family, response regulator FixJ